MSEKEFKNNGEALSAHCEEYVKGLSEDGRKQFIGETLRWSSNTWQFIGLVPVFFKGIKDGAIDIAARLH